MALNSSDLEGRYFPKTYLINKDETPTVVGTICLMNFLNKWKK